MGDAKEAWKNPVSVCVVIAPCACIAVLSYMTIFRSGALGSRHTIMIVVPAAVVWWCCRLLSVAG